MHYLTIDQRLQTHKPFARASTVSRPAATVDCRVPEEPSKKDPRRGYNRHSRASSSRAERNTMPIHDWTRVDAGLFHAFHQSWIITLSRALNTGVLPPDYFALPEQSIQGPVPDVLTLKLSSGRDEPNRTAPGFGRGRCPACGTHLVRRAEETSLRAQGRSDRGPTPARPGRRRGRDRVAREQGEQECSFEPSSRKPRI